MTIIKQFDSEQQQKKFSKRFTYPLMFLIVVLVIVEIWVNNALITYGDKLQNMLSLEKTLKMENQILQNEVARSTSLYNVATESARLGFSRSEKVQYIR